MNYIKDKYYTYVPGEFMPIFEDTELANKTAFHRYKLRRAAWRIANPKATYHQLTNHAG